MFDTSLSKRLIMSGMLVFVTMNYILKNISISAACFDGPGHCILNTFYIILHPIKIRNPLEINQLGRL